MSFCAYRDLPGVNWSTLKHMARSPLHYNAAATGALVKDTPAMAFGRAVHTAVLEPDMFPRSYVVWDGGIRRGAVWESFRAANEAKEIVSAADYERALALRDAVRGHGVAGPLLDNGVAERVLMWIDEQTGITCKARLDWVSDALVDLKTTTDVDERVFGQHAARLGYHGQLAFYRRGLVANGYPETTPVRLIAVESDEPHDVAVYELDDDVLWAGDALVDRLLEELEACMAQNTWPGRYPETTRLVLPSWAWPQEKVSGDSLVVAEREW